MAKREILVFPILSVILIVAYFASLQLSEQAFVGLMLSPANILAGKIWVIITAGFLHGGVMHLLSNIVALIVFGRFVQAELGTKKSLLIYFGALVVSSILSLAGKFLAGSSVPSIGASGAIMGVAAVAGLLAPLKVLRWYFPIPVFVLVWATVFADITGVLSPVADGIDHVAHLGGFISIALLFFFLDDSDKKELKKGLLINGILLILAGIGWAWLNGWFQ